MIKVERVKPVPKDDVRVTMDAETARVLVTVLRKIGGTPDEGAPRAKLNDLLNAFQAEDIWPSWDLVTGSLCIEKRSL